MSEKILFIGGPKDGLRQRLPPAVTGHVLQTPVYERWGACPAVDFPRYNIVTHTYTLKRIYIGDQGEFLEVAVHSSVKDPMRSLIKGYRYHRNPRPRRRP